MKARIAGIGFAAALLLAPPASAVGEEEASSVVPPENSAATQYTEAIPTAGGDKEAHGGRKPSSANALGAKNAKKLESHGKQGREVARIVAETAPAPSAEAPAPQREPSPQAAERPASQKGDDDDSASAGAGGRSEPPNRPEPPASDPKLVSTELPSGSSGFAEVIAEATGSSSSGQLGALLPLAIVATIVWAFGYFWRQRRPVE